LRSVLFLPFILFLLSHLLSHVNSCVVQKHMRTVLMQAVCCLPAGDIHRRYVDRRVPHHRRRSSAKPVARW
jgi:hypothetical protein